MQSSMDAALAELCDNPSLKIAAVARKHEVTRSTLSRRFHGKSVSKTQQYESLRALDDQQERELLNWIKRQSECCLPPTPAMVANIASEMAGRALWSGWSSNFVARHKNVLDSRYLNNMDFARHKADSRDSYELYFSTIGQKIDQYGITAENMYNMDEKGFMIGQCHKTRRIFTKQTFENNKLVTAGQDGNREWVTVLAAICADGSSLSPALIYKAVSGNIQDDWLQDFDPNVHSCYFASTSNGWTSDEHGMAWLNEVFNKETQTKARRSWRLLFIDGHGSHLNMKFIEKCQELKILLAIYPPHSTHRLQPLDVSCFGPLANYYSQGLSRLIMNSEGHTAIKKRDFFPIFWQAYERAFREENIVSAWSRTGIWPHNPQVVLDGLPRKREALSPVVADQQQAGHSSPLEFSTPTRARRSYNRASCVSAKADRRTSRMFNTVLQELSKTSAQLTIAKTNIEHLKETLTREKRQRSRKKKVLEQLRSEGQSATLFMSPTKVQRARDILAVRDQEEQEQQDARVARKKAVAQKKADKQLELAQRRLARAAASAARQAAAAEKKAVKEAARAAKQAPREPESDSEDVIIVARPQPVKQKTPPMPVTEPVRSATSEPVIQVRSRFGRNIQRSVRAMG